MKNIWCEYKENVTILHKNLKRFIKYQIATKLLLAIILLPIFKLIFNSLMKSKGLTYLANGLVKKFLLSPQGVILVIVGFVFGLSVILIELGGLIVISHQAVLKKEESSFFQMVKYSIGKMKSLLGVDGVFIILYLLILAPILNDNHKTSILQNLKIPGYIMDVIEVNTYYTVYLISVTIICAVLAIRWMFCLHVIMLSDKNEKHALHKSSQIVRKNLKLIVKQSLGMNFIYLLVAGGIIIAFTILSLIIMLFLNEQLVRIAAVILVSIGILLVAVLSFLFGPFEVIRVTKLYHKLQDESLENLTIEYNSRHNFIDKLIGNKIFIGTIFIICVIIMSLYTHIVINEAENIKYKVDITAHRGSSKDAPENTLSAIDAAIKNGATFAEIDVQETKDGKLVLLHDKSFMRTTGVDRNVWELTLEEIKKLDTGILFDEKFAGEKIPTLQEVIRYSKDKIKLNIEIKTNGHETHLVSEVVRVIKEMDLISSSIVSSLDYSVLEEVEHLEPRIKTGYIMFVALGNLEKLTVDFYSVEESNVGEKFVEKAHAINREVHVWTINTEESMLNVLELGVDNIITDNDKMLSELIKSKRKGNIFY